MDFILRMVCVYTKLGWQRTKGAYELGMVECGTILKGLVTLAMRTRYVMTIEVLPKQSWHDRRSMGDAKSRTWEVGAVIEH